MRQSNNLYKLMAMDEGELIRNLQDLLPLLEPLRAIRLNKERPVKPAGPRLLYRADRHLTSWTDNTLGQ